MQCHALGACTENPPPPQQTVCPVCRPAGGSGNTKKAKLRTLTTKTPTLCKHLAMIDNLRGFSNSLNHQPVTVSCAQLRHRALYYLLQPTHQAGATSRSSDPNKLYAAV